MGLEKDERIEDLIDFIKYLANEDEQIQGRSPQERYSAALSAESDINKIIESRSLEPEYIVDIKRRVRPLMLDLGVLSKTYFYFD